MTPRQQALAALRHEKVDPDFRLMTARRDIPFPVCERPQNRSGYDAFSVHWTKTPGGGHYTIGQTPIIQDIDNWKSQLRFPNVERLDWSRYAQDAKAVDRDQFLVGAVILMGPFERTTSLTAFDDCLANYALEPEAMYEICQGIADYKISLIRKLHSLAQLDIITLHDDWGHAKSQFLSPETWREVIRPATQRMYECCHELGILISQHSCGCVGPLVPEMIAMGAATAELQGGKLVDIPYIQQTYGDRFYVEPGFDASDMPDLPSFDPNAQPDPNGPDPLAGMPEWMREMMAMPCGFDCEPWDEPPKFLYE